MLNHLTPRPSLPQLSPEQWLALHNAAAAMVNAGLEILDAIRGDADLEDDDPPEDDDGGGDCTDDEPGFDPISRTQANVLGHLSGSASGAGCVINGDCELNGDEGDYGGEVYGV